MASPQFGERRQRFGRLDNERDRVIAQRFAQPAAALVFKQQIPFVPQALAVAQLNPAGYGEPSFTVDPFGSQPDRRRVGQQLRHDAEVFQVQIMADQRTFAVGADRQNRNCRLESDGGAAGRAMGGFHGVLK